MKHLSLILLLAPLLACDPAQSTPADDAARGPIGKADLVGSCEGSCGGPSTGNCWCDESCSAFGDCCNDVQDFCGGCVEGFEFAASQSDCLADAACYELGAGGFCTGECPAGQVLDLDGEPACVDDPMPCPADFLLVATESDCLQDVACFDTGAGWCTGACPEDQELQVDETGAACVPASASCIAGFELVDTESDCLQDAVCYPSVDKFCTGECPEGTQFDMAESGPACLPTG